MGENFCVFCSSLAVIWGESKIVPDLIISVFGSSCNSLYFIISVCGSSCNTLCFIILCAAVHAILSILVFLSFLCAAILSILSFLCAAVHAMLSILVHSLFFSFFICFLSSSPQSPALGRTKKSYNYMNCHTQKW